MKKYLGSIVLGVTWPLPWMIHPTQAAKLVGMLLFVLAWLRLGRDLQRAGHTRVVAYVPRMLLVMLPLLIAVTALLVDVAQVRASTIALRPSDNLLRSAGGVLAVIAGFDLAARREGVLDMMRGFVSGAAIWVGVVWLGLCASDLDPAGMWIGRLLVVMACGGFVGQNVLAGDASRPRGNELNTE